MIKLTLLKDHNPQQEWLLDDDEIDEANEIIESYGAMPRPYWIDIDLEDADAVRECSVCGKLMNEGYYDGDGTEKYYCSDECLHTDYTDEEWQKHYEEHEAHGQTYWTTWWDL